MEKYDVVKDWEKVDLDVLEFAIESSEDPWKARELQRIYNQIESLRDKQLKTFPKLERK